jgi:hypothetical protein
VSFAVQPIELIPMVNTLENARENVDAIRRYLGKWSDFRTSEDLLRKIGDPHDAVVREAMAMLGRLDSLLEESATAVKQTADAYRDTDHNGAARFDATLPAAARPDPADNGIYRPRRFSAADLSQCTGDPVDPADHLKAPDKPMEPARDLDMFKDMLSPTAWIDPILRPLTGWTPVANATRHFAGDWEGYARCAEAFERVNKALNAIAVNIAFRTERVGHTWQGNAADAANAYFHGLAKAIAGQRWMFQSLRKGYRKTAEQVWLNADLVKDIISSLLDDLAISGAAIVLASVVSGGAATALGAGLAAHRVHAIEKKWSLVNGYVTAAESTMEGFASVLIGLGNESAWLKYPLPARGYTAPVA